MVMTTERKVISEVEKVFTFSLQIIKANFGIMCTDGEKTVVY